MLQAFITAYKRYTVYRATYKELSSLSDHVLKDLAIHRSEIERIAHESAYGDEIKTEFSFFKNLFKVKTEKDKIEEYLAESANTFDLENRLKAIDRGMAPWQVNQKTLIQGWGL